MKTPRPSQDTGAAFLAARHHALLADEPGCGKTPQAIWAAQRAGIKTALVICPASVRLHWLAEIRDILGTAAGWDVISYNEAAGDWRKGGRAGGTWDALILDEAHYLKSLDSQRTRAVFGRDGLARRGQRVRWALTGTPVLNRPVELYPLLKCLHPAFADWSFARFTQRYCGAYFDGRAMNVRGSTNPEELASAMAGFMLRRTLAEVAPELPPQLVYRIPLEVSAAELAAVLAEEERQGSREALLSAARENFSQLGDLSTLLRVTGESKVPAAARYVDDLLEVHDKVVVFTRHLNVLDGLAKRLAASGHGVVTFRGGMSDTAKAEAVREFASDASKRVFVAQMQAAGTGVDGLQRAASVAVFAELSWVPAEMTQAIGRLDRIGQKAARVEAHVLHVPGTLEAAMLGVMDSKGRVIERIMADPLEGLR